MAVLQSFQQAGELNHHQEAAILSWLAHHCRAVISYLDQCIIGLLPYPISVGAICRHTLILLRTSHWPSCKISSRNFSYAGTSDASKQKTKKTRIIIELRQH
jgi:hypothetical protein